MALSKSSRWFLVALVAVIATGVYGLRWLDANVFASDVESGVPVAYEVDAGQTVRSVGEELAELDVITSSVRFRLAAEEAELASRMQPGAYELETGMSNEAVIAVLLQGPPPPPTIWFTVQEGLPVSVTLERLAAQFDTYDLEDFRQVLDDRIAAGANGDDVLQIPDWVPEPGGMADGIEAFEGVLFPETYEVLADASPQQILQRMVDQLAIAIDRVPAEQIAEADARGLTPYQMLTIASLIERETRVDAERTLVSGVIANRLGEGMRLQIDATVLYALGEHTDRVLLEDTEIDSPYNTYQVDGLPPTPISGFGAASLRAAFAPADVTFRYYVLDPSCDGTHVFADTLDEHNVNVAAFREAGGCR